VEGKYIPIVLRSVDWYIITDISRDHIVYKFRVKQSKYPSETPSEHTKYSSEISRDSSKYPTLTVKDGANS